MSFRLASYALENIAFRLGIDIQKALNPLDPKDFVIISNRLAKSLRGATKGDEAAALKNAIETLDVDWKNLSSKARGKIVTAARAEVAAAVSASVEAERVLEKQKIVSATRAATVKRYGLDILPAPQRPDETMASAIRRSQMVYIKDEYGRRADAFDKQAKNIVANGMEHGLSSDAIAEDLSTQLAEYQINRSKAYWNLIANDFANKSRTGTQLNAFDEAGIETYTFEAVGDERTCDICMLLDGKTWSVSVVREQLIEAMSLEDPEDIRDARPWLRSNKESIFFEREGKRTVVADISGDGYKQRLSDEEMLNEGISICPVHGECRCTIVAG